MPDLPRFCHEDIVGYLQENVAIGNVCVNIRVMLSHTTRKES